MRLRSPPLPRDDAGAIERCNHAENTQTLAHSCAREKLRGARVAQEASFPSRCVIGASARLQTAFSGAPLITHSPRHEAQELVFKLVAHLLDLCGLRFEGA